MLQKFGSENWLSKDIIITIQHIINQNIKTKQGFKQSTVTGDLISATRVL